MKDQCEIQDGNYPLLDATSNFLTQLYILITSEMSPVRPMVVLITEENHSEGGPQHFTFQQNPGLSYRGEKEGRQTMFKDKLVM